jgi:hypothetical protein
LDCNTKKKTPVHADDTLSSQLLDTQYDRPEIPKALESSRKEETQCRFIPVAYPITKKGNL